VVGGRSPVVARTRAEVVRNQVEVVRSPAAVADLAVADPEAAGRRAAAVRVEADRPAVAAGWSRCLPESGVSVDASLTVARA